MSQQQKYENKNPLHRWALNRFLRRVANAVRASGAQSVLDFASADGYVIKHLKETFPQISLTGVDIDRDALAHARMLNPGSLFLEGNIYTYRHPKPVDLIMALEVLEHLDNVPRALENLAHADTRMLLISVPHEPFFRSINFLRGRHTARFGNHPEHVNLWSKGAFRELLEQKFTVLGDYSSFPWSVFLVKPR